MRSLAFLFLLFAFGLGGCTGTVTTNGSTNGETAQKAGDSEPEVDPLREDIKILPDHGLDRAEVRLTAADGEYVVFTNESDTDYVWKIGVGTDSNDRPFRWANHETILPAGGSLHTGPVLADAVKRKYSTEIRRADGSTGPGTGPDVYVE